ncbi:MAG: aldehyde dehydrogenase [Acidiferrobacteraceae bacterium]|nr:aldehyde dehydrogenase [Acidiferrobacteraceae bacterium]|tara:strand:+ start:360 stop:2723 length:2364 start_codon:yes stop_codon:yes gene_type:complete
MTDIEKIFDEMGYGPALEDASSAHDWLCQHDNAFGHWIADKWTPPCRDFKSINPADGSVLAELSQGTKDDIDSAIRAAGSALSGWQSLSGYQRGQYLYAIARQIQKNSRLFAVLETIDNGKPIRETRDIDVPLAARHFYHHAGWAPLVEQELSDSQPVGVVGQIIPWNFPLLMLAWKVAPALAAGNTVVLKPAEYTSLTALLFAELSHQCGLPKGVLNIVTGDGVTGRLLVEHRAIDKLAFTGSTEVGREIRKATAGSGKALTLELGGKSPFIVFSDADMDSAIEGVVDGIWFNQGEVCCAGSRLLVQESVAAEFESSIKRRMETLRVGSPLDKAIDMGALVDPIQLRRIQRYVEIGKIEGGICWQSKASLPNEGCFFPPTLFTGVYPSHTLAREEVFGPVLVLMTFRTHEEAISLANNSRYGLAASIWSENINLALDVASQLKAGVVWINSTNQFDAGSGFGGYRESGFGREGGIEGLWAYRRAREDLLPDEGLAPHLSEKIHYPKGSETLDRTRKMYIGGKQVRPDGGYSRAVVGHSGELLGEVGEGNRKDIRNSVEAAKAAGGWSKIGAHGRAQVLYFLAENLEARSEEFAMCLANTTGVSGKQEVQSSVKRLFSYASWCDKFEGIVHQAPAGQIVIALPEPIGVFGIICPEESPLLAMVSLLSPVIAMGNTAVLVPSEVCPLVATEFYQVLATSDVPAGVVNIITGSKSILAPVLAEHDDVDAIWCAEHAEIGQVIENLSTGNLKQTWITQGSRNWADSKIGEGREFLRRATQVKNLWVPYGE